MRGAVPARTRAAHREVIASLRIQSRGQGKDVNCFLQSLYAYGAGEAWDLRDTIVYRTRINLAANWHDIWNTLFWPSAIVLLARFTPLFRR